MIRTTDEQYLYNVLILETDSRQAAGLLEELALRGIRGMIAVNHQQAVGFIEKLRWSLVFISEDFLKLFVEPSTFLKLRFPEVPMVLIGSQDSSHKALEAVRKGFSDYLPKPLEKSRVSLILDHFVPNHRVEVAAVMQSGSALNNCIVGSSAELRRTVELARKAAGSSAPILIEGESGTGKELLAQWIHENSRRKDGPFIKVNCAALNESLLESELFGHEKGAFTGALFTRKGRFEQAHGGTLLLDEITETPPAFQAKLLRALEQMCFERVGGNDSVTVNVRILCTTNRPIVEMIKRGEFRPDLYYRISGVRLVIPPLRQRQEDIPQLIWLFVNEFAHECPVRISGIERRTLELLKHYSWPGNIRQLRNIVRSAMILGHGECLSVETIPWLLDELRDGLRVHNENLTESASLAGTSLEELERRAILETLNRENGNQLQAARLLGISDRTLREKIKRYRRADEVESVAEAG